MRDATKSNLVYLAAWLCLMGIVPMPQHAGAAGERGTTIYNGLQPNDGVLPAELVNPPKTAAVNEFVILDLKVDATVVDWLCQHGTGVDPTFRALAVYKGMGPDGKPLLDYCAFFAARKAGWYFFSIACTKDNKQAHVKHAILVTGSGPSPDPDPGPGPNPNPTPGRRWVIVLYETQTLSAAHAQVLQRLRLYSAIKEHKHLAEDKDSKSSSGQTPAWLQSLLSLATQKQVALPALVVAELSTDGKKMVNPQIVALPTTSADAIKYVQDCGG